MQLTVRWAGCAHDGPKQSLPSETALVPVAPLTLSAIVFAATRIGWMDWWSVSLAPVNIIMLESSGAAVGYTRYRAMRWQFRRRGMLARNARTSDPGPKDKGVFKRVENG